MSKILGRAGVDIPAQEGDFPEEPILAAGVHQAMITEITEGRNEEKAEDWVKVRFRLIGGPYDGQTVTDWWSYGVSEVREQISDKKFKTLLTLCGVTDALVEYSQLYNVHIGINNKPYQANDGSMRNSFNYYKRGSTPRPVTQAPPPQQAGVIPQQMPPAPPPPPAPTPAPNPPPMAQQFAPPPPPPQAIPQAPPTAAGAPPVYQAAPPMQQQAYYHQPAGPDIGDGGDGDPPF